jgi:hypothetical protein
MIPIGETVMYTIKQNKALAKIPIIQGDTIGVLYKKKKSGFHAPTRLFKNSAQSEIPNTKIIVVDGGDLVLRAITTIPKNSEITFNDSVSANVKTTKEIKSGNTVQRDQNSK